MEWLFHWCRRDHPFHPTRCGLIGLESRGRQPDLEPPRATAIQRQSIPHKSKRRIHRRWRDHRHCRFCRLVAAPVGQRFPGGQIQIRRVHRRREDRQSGHHQRQRRTGLPGCAQCREPRRHHQPHRGDHSCRGQERGTGAGSEPQLACGNYGRRKRSAQCRQVGGLIRERGNFRYDSAQQWRRQCQLRKRRRCDRQDCVQGEEGRNARTYFSRYRKWCQGGGSHRSGGGEERGRDFAGRRRDRSQGLCGEGRHGADAWRSGWVDRQREDRCQRGCGWWDGVSGGGLPG